MSGENIYNLLAKNAPPAATGPKGQDMVYTGKYEKKFDEQSKPSYSTFWERGKEYDGSHARYFKQRDAIIGPSVADSVDPKSYLKKGGGVRYVVPPIHEDKMITKPPLDHTPGFSNAFGAGASGPQQGNGAEDGDRNALSAKQVGGAEGVDANGVPYGANAGAGGAEYLGPYGGGSGGPLGGYKDFVTSNIVEMSNMVPKRRKDQPEFATSRKDFGKTPAYIDRVKGELEQEKSFLRTLEMQKNAHREQMFSRYVFQLSEAEHKSLIAKLQKKLQEKTLMYNKIPFSKDTLETAKKKGELERGIKDIEEALKKLDREAIFIYKDDPVNAEWTKKAAMEEACKYLAAK